jgi:hypothetical protein
VNLRWKTAKDISKQEFEEFVEKYTSYGVEIEDTKKRRGFGVVEDEDSELELENLSNVYSLADCARRYSANAIFIMKVKVDTEPQYWCCLVSNGIPVIDYADESLDSAIRPALNRLSDVDGQNLLIAEHVSVVVDEEIKNVVDNSEVYQDILNRRDFHVNRLSGLDLYTRKGEVLNSVSFGNIFSKFINQKVLILSAVVTIAILAIGFAATGKRDPYADLDFGEQNNVIEVIDYTGDVEKDVTIYMAGSDPMWLSSAIGIWDSWPSLKLPLQRTRGDCKLNESKVECSIAYQVTNNNLDPGPAFIDLKSQSLGYKASLNLRSLVVKDNSIVELKGFKAEDLDRLPDLDGVRVAISKFVNINNKVDLTLGELKIRTIGGKQKYFSTLDDETVSRLTIAELSFRLVGSGQRDFVQTVNNLSRMTTFKTNNVQFSGTLPISWEFEGSFVMRKSDNESIF